jgi:hypothetical protein
VTRVERPEKEKGRVMTENARHKEQRMRSVVSHQIRNTG